MIQMNLIKFPITSLSANIFDLQSHRKTTTAFLANKFYTISIHKTYIDFLGKHLHTFTFCILTSKQFRLIHRKPPVSEPCFYQSCIKERLRHSCFPVNFGELLRTLFYRTPPGDCLFRSWCQVVRDVLALLLMTDFMKC